MSKKNKDKNKFLVEGTPMKWSEMTPEQRVQELQRTHKSVNVKKPAALVYREECHKGNVVVFTDPVSGLEISAGGTSRGVKWYPDTLLIDLANGFETVIQCEGIDSPELLRIGRTSPKITITWRDYGTPSLVREDWMDLVDGLRAARLAGKIPSKVLVACIGGHGRTGTCLAILAGLMGVCEGKDPVEWIRARYCKNAAESETQLSYVEEITQIEVKANVPFKPQAVAITGYMRGGVYCGGGHRDAYAYDVPYSTQTGVVVDPLVRK